MTTLKTQLKKLNGKFVKVLTVLGNNSRQDVSYVVNGKPVSYNAYHKMFKS